MINTCQNCKWSWLSFLGESWANTEPVLRCRPGGKAPVQLAEIVCLEWERDEFEDTK